MISQVLVYRLYDQDALKERDAALEQYLSVAGRAIEPSFEALPNGCFRWKDVGRLRADSSEGALPNTAAEARKAAAVFMRAANDAAARYRVARGIEVSQHPDPFPLAALLPVVARRVRAHEANDHWLITWNVHLPSTPGPEGGRSPVVGSTVEVRVGVGGHVYSVVSRARPWQAVLVRAALDWEGPDDEGHEHPNGRAHQGDPPLVYISDNPYEPLRFLAPCWVIQPEDKESHHARRLWAACDHTLLPEIFVEDQNGEARVWALILTQKQSMTLVEHGGDWRVRWAVANLPQYIAGKFLVSEGTSAQLPGPGLYQVELEVEHIGTGALRTTHRQIPVAVHRRPLERRGSALVS